MKPDFNIENPIEAKKTLFIAEMTWMEIRDAMQDGKTTIIIPTGGLEQNGLNTVRLEQRRKAGLVSINGVSIDPPEKIIELGKRLVDFQVDKAIKQFMELKSQATISDLSHDQK